MAAAAARALPLPRRALLAVGGADARRFLQGLLTADVGALAGGEGEGDGGGEGGRGGSRCAYAAVLNSRGKIAHDLFLHAGCARVEAAAGAGGVVLECAEESVERLAAALRRHRLRARVDIEEVEARELGVAVAFRNEGGAAAPTWDELAGALAPDPRAPQLARRGLLPEEAAAPSAWGDGGEHAAYVAWRYAHGLAEGPSELPPGELSALECNLEAMGAVSFSKGCYLGQEPVARAHHTGVVRKRVMPVALRGSGAASAAPGDELVVSRGGRGRANAAGRLLAARGGAGLAMLRLVPAAAAAARGAPPLEAAAADYTAAPSVPSWWRPEWTAGLDAAR